LTTPEETQQEESNSLPEITFDKLVGKLKNAAKNAGWDSLMPVQRKVLPYLFATYFYLFFQLLPLMKTI